MTFDEETTLVLPTRIRDEAARSSWIRFAKTVRESGKRGVIIDKTPNQSVALELSRTDLASEVEVILAPYSEAYFRSMCRVEAPRDGFIQTFHDDDQWSGPLNYSFAAQGVSIPINISISPPRRNKASLLATQQHLSVFLGALSGVVWQALRKLVDMQGTQPSGALDIALVAAARTCGISQAMIGFHYEYNYHHWADTDEALRRNIENAAEAGWDDWASEELLQLLICLDTLALLGFLATEAHPTQLIRTQTHVIRSMPPRHRRTVRMADYFHVADRVALYRLQATQSRHLSQKGMQQNSDLVRLCLTVRDISQVISALLPWLRQNAPAGIREKVDCWQRGITLLDDTTSRAVC